MAMIWTICGAGRGVGKTHLGLSLCELLPNAVYAKLGCGERKPGKPENLFATEEALMAFIAERRDRHEHLVVEANTLVHQGVGDIIIFLDRIPRSATARGDVDTLRERAHLCVCGETSPRTWKRVLKSRFSDAALVDRICEQLAAQHRYNCGPDELRVRSKVWFVAGSDHVFGSGLAGLLAAIDRCGTLTEAARRTGMSYRRAWDLIKDAEGHLGKLLIIPHPGGAGGGQSSLSPEGKQFLEVFQKLNSEVAVFADERFAWYFKREGRDG